MSIREFLVIYAITFATILACRIIPLFALRGRTLSPRVSSAISLIPAAAFAALVANDLVQPDTYAQDPRVAVCSFVSAAVVVVVARKTGSLVWCAVTGLVSYALLSWLI